MTEVYYYAHNSYYLARTAYLHSQLGDSDTLNRIWNTNKLYIRMEILAVMVKRFRSGCSINGDDLNKCSMNVNFLWFSTICPDSLEFSSLVACC